MAGVLLMGFGERYAVSVVLMVEVGAGDSVGLREGLGDDEGKAPVLALSSLHTVVVVRLQGCGAGRQGKEGARSGWEWEGRRTELLAMGPGQSRHIRHAVQVLSQSLVWPRSPPCLRVATLGPRCGGTGGAIEAGADVRVGAAARSAVGGGDPGASSGDGAVLCATRRTGALQLRPGGGKKVGETQASRPRRVQLKLRPHRRRRRRAPHLTAQAATS